MTRKKLILVVEDAAASKEIFQIAIQSKDTDILIASDGEEGVRLAFEKKPDVILLDMMLPIISGYEAAERIKANPETAHIPIIAVTARAMDPERERALAAGCSHFIAKPFRLSEIRDAIDKFLGRRVAG